jgi:hypothetical protein
MRKAVKIVTFYDDGTFTESVPSLEPPAPNPSMPYQPNPTNPWVQPYPWYPPYTVTCKMADGTTRDITLDSPIVAQASMVENILAGEAVVEDFGGYEESTREKYEAFVTQRNYHYTNTDNPVDFPNENLCNSRNT